jgi:exonuclease VII large subunit
MKQMHVQNLLKTMQQSIEKHLNRQKAALAQNEAKLEKSSPYAVWRQGFALVQRETGEGVLAAADLEKGAELRLHWPDGWAKAKVTAVKAEPYG